MFGNIPWRTLAFASSLGMLVALGTNTAAYGQAETAPSCTSSQVSAEIQLEGVGLSNLWALLILTNQGAECTLRGFPGLRLVSADGRPLGTRVDTRTPEDQVPTVTLSYLDGAASELHWVHGRNFSEGDDGTPGSLPVSITLSLPGDTDGITMPWNFGFVLGETEGPAEIDATAFTVR